MKQIISKLTLIALVMSLSACSTNTNNENTAIGTGTGAVVGGLAGSLVKGSGAGWVIAAGAIVGALIGGAIGHSMDSTDHTNMNTAMNNNSIDEPSNWTNNNTGMWYKIVPTSGVMEYKGSNYCRHYKAFGKTNSGKQIRANGIACRGNDGMWHKVR